MRAVERSYSHVFPAGSAKALRNACFPNPCVRFYPGKSRDTHGAETLSAREWDSLLLYSYLLRGVLQPEPAPRNHTGPAHHGISDLKEHVAVESNSRVLGRIPDEGRQRLPAGKLRTVSGCGDCVSTNTCDMKTAQVGGRKLYGLRNSHPRATVVVSQGKTGHVRRPSSAPARPSPGKGVSQNASRFATQAQVIARRAAFSARSGKADSGICCAGPGAWGLPEQEELLHGLVRCVNEHSLSTKRKLSPASTSIFRRARDASACCRYNYREAAPLPFNATLFLPYVLTHEPTFPGAYSNHISCCSSQRCVFPVEALDVTGSRLVHVLYQRMRRG